MGHYVFDLKKNPLSKSYTKAEDFANSPNYNNADKHTSGENALSFCINKFFSQPDIVKWVEQDNWNAVIEAWASDFDVISGWTKGSGIFYGNKPGWSIDMLVTFLGLAGIDFWSNLDYDGLLENIDGLEYIPDEGEEY